MLLYSFEKRYALNGRNCRCVSMMGSFPIVHDVLLKKKKMPIEEEEDNPKFLSPRQSKECTA